MASIDPRLQAQLVQSQIQEGARMALVAQTAARIYGDALASRLFDLEDRELLADWKATARELAPLAVEAAVMLVDAIRDKAHAKSR